MNDIYQENDKIRKLLLKNIRESHTAHAYIFSGGSKESREELGNWFASALLCTSEEPPCGACLSCRKIVHGNHEDMIHIAKESDRETISVEQISTLVEKLSFKPYGNRYAVIIEDAELMNTSAQNKLLKTLEEPVSETVLVLLCDKTESLLPTILSRCVKFYLSSSGSSISDEIQKSAEAFAALALSGAPYYKKKNAIQQIISDKENSRSNALQFIDALEDVLSEKLTADAGLPACSASFRLSEMIRMAETVRKNLVQLHSVPWTIKQLCLK